MLVYMDHVFEIKLMYVCKMVKHRCKSVRSFICSSVSLVHYINTAKLIVSFFCHLVVHQYV